MDNLNRFYNDEHTREDVKEFFLKYLDKIALERVYEGKDTAGIADAKEVISGAFIELKEQYSPEVKPKNHSPR